MGCSLELLRAKVALVKLDSAHPALIGQWASKVDRAEVLVDGHITP